MKEKNNNKASKKNQKNKGTSSNANLEISDELSSRKNEQNSEKDCK